LAEQRGGLGVSAACAEGNELQDAVVDPEGRVSRRREGFDAEVLVCEESLLRESRRLTGNADEARDLVQETYVKALQHSSRFTWGTSLKAWLLTILRNAAANRRRGHRRSRVDVDEARVEWSTATVHAPGETPEQALLRKTLDPQLKEALESLPTALREAVWRRDVEEMTYAEMADALGVPIGTVMSRIFRGRQRLYQELAGRIERPTGEHHE